MEIINLDKERNYKLPKDCSLCLGMFDGVHLGHQALFKQGKEVSSKVAILTFPTSPKFMLNSRSSSSLITPLTKREEILESLGIDIVLTKDFDSDFASLSPVEFITNFLNKLEPSSLVIGFDYHFGKFGKGDFSLLSKYFKTYQVSEVEDSKGKISSTRIIDSLLKGNMNDVNHCLNRVYEMDGKVVHGLRNGHLLKFPTANIELKDDYYLPKIGVYIGLIKINNIKYQTMVNIGYHPTIDKLEAPSIEAFILDFNDEIYDADVTLYIYSYLRDEKKFASLEGLKDELTRNEQAVREFFKKENI